MKLRLFAKKSLGQNFLTSPRVVQAIISAGELSREDVVIEIGPGKGVLTRALLSSGAKVMAIEKDDRLIPVLSESFKEEIASKQLKLVHGDILETNIDEVTSDLTSKYKVIANIPYYITGALVRNFLSAKNKPERMILMVQKEVATRIMANDGKESILSLAVKVYAKPELVMNVSRGNFFPIPNVDSAVIKLGNIKNPFVNEQNEEKFFEIIKAGFAQKRKKLSSNLKKVMKEEVISRKFSELEIDKNVRAEDVSLEKWLRLATN